ncbi:methylcytosine dioxygenase TET2 [Ambystoma mexicanum]|uniref:methylcytosine dioxygenase TET2 n=1 Tax=Ambystoma mexicanum TaxID=8296 RepID=UPI0037E85F6B
MEQDRIDHADGSILSPFLITHSSPSFQRETRSLKFQNGRRSAERVHLQVNGENKYTPFPSSYPFAHIKGNQKNCMSPDVAYEKNESPKPMQNGGVKRTSSESYLNDPEKIKKDRRGEEVNGEDGDLDGKQKQPSIFAAERNLQEEHAFSYIRRSSRLNCGRSEPPLAYRPRPQPPPAYRPKTHHESKHDNSDSLSKFKDTTVTMPNGANIFTSSKGNVHDELFQKTLSHCDPERISTVARKNSPLTNSIDLQRKLSPESTPLTDTSRQSIPSHPCAAELQQVPAVPVRNGHEVNGQAATGRSFDGDAVNDLKVHNHSNETLSGHIEGNYSVFKQNPAFRNDFPTTLSSGRNSILRMGRKDYSYCNQSGENLSEAVDGADGRQNRPKSQSPSVSQGSQSLQPGLQDAFSNEGLLMLASLSELESLDGLRESPQELLQRLHLMGGLDVGLQHRTDVGTRTLSSPLPEKETMPCATAKDLTSQAHLKAGWGDSNAGSFHQGFSPQISDQDLLKSVIQCQSRAEEHAHLRSHTGSPSRLKGIAEQRFLKKGHISPLCKSQVSPLQQRPASEHQQHFQKPSLQGQPPIVDSPSRSSEHQRNQQWCLDFSRHGQQMECNLDPQLKQQHLNPQPTEADPFLHARFSPQSQHSQQPSPSQRFTQLPDQQHVFRGRPVEKLPHTLAHPHIKSEPLTFSQNKLEEFIQIEKQYTKPQQPHLHTPEAGLEQLTHQESKLPSFSPPPYPNVNKTHNSCSDSEKKEHAVIRELFAFNKRHEIQHMQHYPNGKAPNLDHSCFQGKEQQQQMEQTQAPYYPLQPKQEYDSPRTDLSIQRTTQSSHTLLPHFGRTPPPTPDRRGRHHPTLNNKDSIRKYSALRSHLLHKMEKQKKEPCPDFPRPIKMEPSSDCAVDCQTPTQTPTQTPEKEKKVRRRIKRENHTFGPDNLNPMSILDTMEEQLKRFQVKSPYNNKPLRSKSPKYVKVETSGSVTVLTTHAKAPEYEGYPPGLDHQKLFPSEKTPTKRKSGSYLNNFLESPSTLFDTPIKNLLDTPAKTQYDFPSCSCVEQIIEKDEGPYYTHLGVGPSVAAIRDIMEERFGEKGDAIRIERLVYTGKEGRSSQGCPIAKWVIRRSSKTEKVLCLVRERAGHSCENAVVVIAILVWEGISRTLADTLYNELTETLPKYGAITARRCALNEERTCACQGLDSETCGASFSFGCSWSMYYNGCKFARSRIPRKFKLMGDDPKEEERLEAHLQNLSTLIAPTYKKLAPDAYNNQIEYEHRAPDCRLGLKEGRPFSGVTACLDFCAHSHRDLHNMQNGSTLVCTLTREDNREIGKIPEDEQLHVLPLYRVSTVDEFGSVEGQEKKIKSGAIQALHAFRRPVRMHSEPVKTCRQKKLEAKRAAAERLSGLENGSSKSEKEKPSRQKHGESAAHAKQLAEILRLSGSAPQSDQQKLARNPSSISPYPGTDSSAHYMRRHPPSDPYQSSANSSDRYGGRNPMNIYSSASHSSSPYLNSSNPMSPYSGPLHQNSQCSTYPYNGGLPAEMCPPYMGAYPSHPQHMDMFRCPSQDPVIKLNMPPIQSQYGQKYLNYASQNMQGDSYNVSGAGPNVHHAGSYSPYPSHQSELAMDYTTLNRNGEYTPHAPAYHAQGSNSVNDMYSGHQNSIHLSKKGNNLSSLTDNGTCNMLPALNHDRTNPSYEGENRTNGAIVHENLPETPLKNRTRSRDDRDGVWSDSEQSFLDPEIGGVAVAPTHGSLLIECAKRELHATTPLKNPNRNHPTRISLVFYQHKSMNEPKHGLALWEAKMAGKAREKEEDCEKYGPDYVAPKCYPKKVKREPMEFLQQEHSEQTYMHFIKSVSQRTVSMTTTSTSTSTPYAFTRVTGPYNRYI